MFRRSARPPQDPDLAAAWALVDEGKLPAAMARLRAVADDVPLVALARVVGHAGATAGYDDLAEAAAALADRSSDPKRLYDFGYACIDRGIAGVGLPALREGVRLAPTSRGMLAELVAGLEADGRHAEVVQLLGSRGSDLPDWPERYLLAFNALMAGDVDSAARQYQRLSPPQDARWDGARLRLGRALDRAELARQHSALDGADLRGWHFALAGGLLASLSPYGFDAGMTGRYAYLQETSGSCRSRLDRLGKLLTALGSTATSVSPLPDRDSQILGLAAARVLGRPVVPFSPDRGDTVVVAADLRTGPDLLPKLSQSVSGQVLYELATCWTQPPPVAADISGLLAQTTRLPWHEHLRLGPDGTAEPAPADGRRPEEIAAELADTAAVDEAGDDDAPPDSDDLVVRFASGVRPLWLQGGQRAAGAPEGPVRSSRFL